MFFKIGEKIKSNILLINEICVNKNIYICIKLFLNKIDKSTIKKFRPDENIIFYHKVIYIISYNQFSYW